MLPRVTPDVRCGNDVGGIACINKHTKARALARPHAHPHTRTHIDVRIYIYISIYLIMVKFVYLGIMLSVCSRLTCAFSLVDMSLHIGLHMCDIIYFCES